MERGLTRRNLIKYSTATGIVLMIGVAETSPVLSFPKPTVSLIRWGGWFPNNRWQNNLKDPQFYNNLPFFAQVMPDGAVVVDGSKPEVMEQQDLDCRQAGIDAYASVFYHPEGPFSQYNYYTDFSRPKKVSADAPKYSLILQGMHVGQAEDWSGFVNDTLLKHFSSERYLFTPDGQAVVSMYYLAKFYERFGGEDQARQKLDYLKDQTRQLFGKPALLIGLNPEEVPSVAGFDAVSAYTACGNGQGVHPFSDLVDANRGYRGFLQTKGKIVIPPLNISWDPSARFKDEEVNSIYPAGYYFSTPTPDQFEAHVASNVAWLTKNPQTYNSVLINSLDEYDESGKTLSRLLNEGTIYLDALSRGLNAGING